MNITPVKRALISVSNKTGIADFAKKLFDLGIEIISTGGTSQVLHSAGIPHRQVDDITGLSEMLNGRVKTLHPKLHGGILGKRDTHALEAAQHGIDWIDLVVVNFYPFATAVKNQALTWDEAVEYIDIGGPAMVRAAAKNFAWVGVVIDPSDYMQILTDLNHQHGLGWLTRKKLAEKVFKLTAEYEAMIYDYFSEKNEEVKASSPVLNVRFEQALALRYGENPHQKAYAYALKGAQSGVLSAKQHQGKPLSFNNILDAEAATTCLSEFEKPTCVIVKHANPCGVASATNIEEAYTQAYQADALSAFGGIVALNQLCTETLAQMLINIFLEVIIAPAYTEEALAVLASKANLRVLEMSTHCKNPWEMRFITGGMLYQEKDPQIIEKQDLKVVTKKEPTLKEIDTMLFAWRVLKHIKSNGILIAKEQATVGIGAGQVSRVDAVDLAVRKAADKTENTILASDAFFPFRDSIDRLANTGIKAIIQPGGSMRDEEVIAACNEHGIAMVLTGKRCFKH